MGQDRCSDHLQRQNTPGTFEHFAHTAKQAMQEANDTRGLPNPDALLLLAHDLVASREPFATYLTPKVAQALGEAAEKGTLRDGLLVVNAHMPAQEFGRLRKRALRKAGVKSPSKRGGSLEHDLWRGMLFLYLTELENASPADLASEYLSDNTKDRLRRDRRNANRLAQKVRDDVDAARGTLRQLGVQI